MRKGGGKQKGASFERYVCRELSKWVTRGKRQDIFWRSAMSGGRSTVALKSGTVLAAQAGDVSAIDPIGQKFIENFLAESKHVKNLDIDSLIKGSGNLVNFWKRLRADCAKYGKLPFLVARQNNFPIMVCTTRTGLELLKIEYVEAIYPQLQMRIIWWEDFLKSRPLRERSRL